MSERHSPHQGGHDFDSVEGSRGSSGTQSPWRRDPSPPNPSGDEQHPDPQEEYLAHVGAGANTQPADRKQAENTVAHEEAIASAERPGTEENRAGLQTASERFSNDEDSADIEEGKYDLSDPDDEDGSRMDVEEQEEDRGDPRG